MRNCALASHRGAQRVGARPADMVLILGDIGEVRKKAEGADDLQRVLRLQRIQCGFEIASRRQILVSAEAHRILPDILDGVENCIAALLGYPACWATPNCRTRPIAVVMIEAAEYAALFSLPNYVVVRRS